MTASLHGEDRAAIIGVFKLVIKEHGVVNKINLKKLTEITKETKPYDVISANCQHFVLELKIKL